MLLRSIVMPNNSVNTDYPKLHRLYLAMQLWASGYAVSYAFK